VVRLAHAKALVNMPPANIGGGFFYVLSPWQGTTLAGRALAGRALAGRAVAGRAVAGRAVAGRAVPLVQTHSSQLGIASYLSKISA
jgi:hypothetical protein